MLFPPIFVVYAEAVLRGCVFRSGKLNMSEA
jgi:hypothetical protein